MKKTLQGILLALFVFIFTFGVALAAYEFYFPTVATDNTSATRTYYPIMLGINGQSFIDSGKIDADGLDTNMQIGATDVKYMVSTTNISAVAPNLPANGLVTFNFYTGYSPEQTTFPIVVGDGGYVTIADSANQEHGANFTETLNDVGLYGDGDIISKASAYILSKSSTNVTFAIIDILGDNYIINDDIATTFTSTRYLGQVFNSSFTSTAYQVEIKVFTGGAATATIQLRDVSGGKPGSTVYASTTVSSAGWGATPGTFQTITWSPNYGITSGTDYSVVVYASGASNNWRYDTAGSAYAGSAWYSNDSGGTWTTLGATADFMFQINLRRDVAVTGIADGEYDVTVTADGTNVWMTVGSSVSANTTVAAVPDNANNIVLGSNATPYIGSYTLAVGGNQQARLEPNTMIVGTNIPDRGIDATSNNGTITWGTNTGIELHYGEMVSSGSTSASTSITTGTPLRRIGIPTHWYNQGADLSGLPFYDAFNSAATDAGQPVQLYYFWVAIAFAWLMMMVVTVSTKSAVMGAIFMVLVLTVSSMQGVVPGWLVFGVIVIDTVIVYLYRQVAS